MRTYRAAGSLLGPEDIPVLALCFIHAGLFDGTILWVIFKELILITPRIVKQINESRIQAFRDKFSQAAMITDDIEKSTIFVRDWIKKREEFKAETVRKIRERDKDICQYCNKKTYDRPTNKAEKIYHILDAGKKDKYIEIDHLFADKLGGKPTYANGVVSCRKCNRKKSDRLKEPFLSVVLKLAAERQPNELIYIGAIG